MNEQRQEIQSQSQMPDTFDRLMGLLDGLPDVTRCQPSPIRVTPPFGVGGTELFVIQTIRQREQGDTIFIEHSDRNGMVRLVIPPKVAATIARQRDQLTTKSRSRAAKAVAKERRARGEVPGFMKHRKAK